MNAVETLQRIKERYFRPVIKYPKGFLNHWGDCSTHRHLAMYDYAPCDCGLLKDMVLLPYSIRSKLYPHYWGERLRQEMGRFKRNPITTPIEELFPGAKVVDIPVNDGEEWAAIESVFGTEYRVFLESLKTDQKCPRCGNDWCSQLSSGCPYCSDAFPTWKVISGGQTGADIAGLRVADRFGLETGGWIPKGFRTTAGPRPEYERLYGMKEDVSQDYVPRTIRNVADSDGTVRLAANFQSPGEKCTLRAIKDLHKPYFDVDLTDQRPPVEMGQWLQENKIYVLNVAGNAVTTYPEAEREATVYLTEVFSLIFRNSA